MKKIIDLSDGSPDWDIWRLPGITGGDAGILTGSPFATPFQLWLWKTKREPRPSLDGLPHIEKGKRLEVIAREKYEALMDDVYPAAQIFNDDHGFPMKSALDGLSMDATHGTEYKFVPDDVYAEIVAKDYVHPYYRSQCLHYVIAGKLETFDFVAINSKLEITIVELTWTEEDLTQLIEIMEAWWHHFTEDSPPEKTDKDTEQLGNNEDVALLFANYAVKKKAFDDAQEEFNKAKKILQEISEDAGMNIEHDAGKVSRFWKDGSELCKGHQEART